jgi:hypothetical protein
MNYCVYTIAAYMEPKEAMRLNQRCVKRFFPRTLEIRGLEDYQAFCDFAQTVETSRLEEVRIVLTDFDRLREPIGWVPPSVRKLSLYVTGVVPVEIPATVEELVIERYGYYQCLTLPDTVRDLTLMDEFDGVVGHWPEALEELRLRGWCSGNGRVPMEVDHLPANLKRVTLNNDLDIEIGEWPEGLEEVVLEGYGPWLNDLRWPHAQLWDEVRFTKVAV